MNILIVDDEPLIHISIEKLIKTCSPEDTVLHAYNGRQMLDCLTGHDFALAYVDIKMPGLSGLEAIRQARDISPSTSYYIMTGFDEFEYAKQAIRLRVDDYLMKPLDLKTIRETVEGARLHMQQTLEHRKNVFRNWLESTLNRRDGTFGDYEGCYCALILVSADSTAISADAIQAPFTPYNGHLVSVYTEDGLLLLSFSESSEYLHEMSQTLASLPCPKGVTCVSTSITREPDELKTALPALMKYAQLRVLLGTGRFYYLNPLMDYPALLSDFCHTCINWQTAHGAGDYTAFSNESEVICSQLKAHPQLLEYAENLCAFLSLVLGCAADEFPRTPELLREHLQQAARELLTVPAMDTKVQAIIRFIQEHYRENISAADLSDRFGLSANYISNLLKNTLGIRYNDYVTQLRLNHAKELLASTHQSVKEITSACGYYSQSHFTKLFLEREGCTPLEFRKSQK